MSNKPVRETPLQNTAFLIYAQVPEPSVHTLWEKWGRNGGDLETLKEYRRPAEKTLERWCKQFHWVVRAEAIHQAAKEEAVKRVVEQLAMSKTEILAITRAIMIRYGQQLREDTQGKITMADFEKAWRIQRIELGLPVEIGRQELNMQDAYADLSDWELLAELERLTVQYKEKIKHKWPKVEENRAT